MYNIFNKIKNFNNKNIIIANIILNAIIIVIALGIKSYNFDSWLLPFSILSLLQFFLNLLVIMKFENSFFSLTTLFFIFSYITHLGTILIFSFDINVYLPWDPLTSITENAYKNACYFIIFCHAFLTLGMSIALTARTKYNSSKNITTQNEEKELEITKKIGITLICLGILPMLYIDINRLLLYIQGNYYDTYELNIHGFVVIIRNMAEVGAMMLLISNYKNKKKATLIFLIIILYQAIIIFTGNRGRATMYLITIVFIYGKLIIKKIDIKKSVWVLILTYLAGVGLVFIGKIRISANPIANMKNILIDSFKNFSVFSILAEFGMSIITLGHSLTYFPGFMHSQFGTNYLYTVFTIFPNIGGFLNPINEKIRYIHYLPKEVTQFLGGSYLGELIFGFGGLGILFVLIIGLFIGYISNQIYKYIKQKRYTFLSIYLILFPNILWWIRDYFGSMIREFVWISVFILILYKVFNKSIRLSFRK